MFNPKKYIGHSEFSEHIAGDDFTYDEDLLEKVNHEGELNDVRYTVSTGCVVAPDVIDYYDEEEQTERFLNKKGILEVAFVG